MKLLQKSLNFFKLADLTVYLQSITMKKILFILCVTFGLSLAVLHADAQCSICAKTVMQMGNKPAQGFNNGILYLMAIPYLAIGVVGFKWWQNEKRKS